MKKKVEDRIIAVQDAAMVDHEYLQLAQEQKVMNQELLELLDTLQEDQKETILNYLGLCAQMHMRMLELLCDL